MITKNNQLLRVKVLLTTAVLVTAACSDGGDGQRAGRGATGTPIVVGLINQEDAPVGSFPEFRREAQVAVRYVNEELDGVGGRPIQLETCATNGSPESSQGCANKLRARGVVAVIGGVDLGAGASLAVFEQAGIPYVSTSPALGEELTSDTAFMLTGGTAADLLGQAAYVTDTLQAKKIGILYLDLPGLLATAVAATKQVLNKKGVTDVKLVAAKADARDLTPSLAQVNQGNPEVIVSVFPPQGCARIMQARESLGIEAKMFYPGACADETVLETAGEGADGAYFATGFVPYTDRSNPDVSVYLDKTEEKKSVLSQAGFAVVMDLRAILSGLAEPLTPQAVASKLDATRAQPGFMSHDYTCDGKQVPLLTAICNPNVRLIQHKDQTFTDIAGTWINGAGLVKLFTG